MDVVKNLFDAPMHISDEAIAIAEIIVPRAAPMNPPPFYDRDRVARFVQIVSDTAASIRKAAPAHSLVHTLCDHLTLPDPVTERAHAIFAKHSVGNSKQDDDHPVMKMIIEALREGMIQK